MRQWKASHNAGANYSGAGWFRINIGPISFADDHPANNSQVVHQLVLTAACGYISGWINGVVLQAPDQKAVSPAEPTRLTIPGWALRQSGSPNVLALRFETKQEFCTDNAGLMGRVFIASRI